MANKPTHHAYHVREYKAGGEKKSSWTKVGSAWAHEDGQGFNLRLHAHPVDGEVVLRTVKEQKAADEGDED